MKKKYSIISITILILLVSMTSFAEHTEAEVSIQDFIPTWSKGDFWQLKISALATESPMDIKSIETWECLVKVIEADIQEKNIYILRFLIDDKECLFFTLDSKDLSLLEYRKINLRGLEPEELEAKINNWEEIKKIKEYPGGVPIIIQTDFLRLAFPVLMKDVNPFNKTHEYTIVQKHNFIDDNNIKVLVTKAETTEIAIQHIEENKSDYTLFWKKGEPWWSSCSLLSESDYRIELVIN